MNETEPDPTPSLLLPAGTRLFHIGIPKTGTTALQRTASGRRGELLEHGVHYPGRAFNHRVPVSGLMGRRWGWSGKGHSVPPIDEWHGMIDEIDSVNADRVLISHEFGSEADDEIARRFVEELGRGVHIVVTLRGVGSILPSAWQQYLKTGYAGGLDEWLHGVLSDPPDNKVTPSFHLRNDQGGVVTRWANAAGPENVTVIILDKVNPDLLPDSFEALLGLPHGMLQSESDDGFHSNRGMSVQESELFRQLNLLVKGNHVHWDDYNRLIRNGAVARMLANRMPGTEESPVRLPGWAADRAVELGRGYATAIAASGVRVIGNLEQLSERVRVRESDDDSVPTMPPKAAAEALAGLFSQATLRGPFFADLPESPLEKTGNDAMRSTAEMPTASVSTMDLVRVLGGRIARKYRDIRRDARKRRQARAVSKVVSDQATTRDK